MSAAKEDKQKKEVAYSDRLRRRRKNLIIVFSLMLALIILSVVEMLVFKNQSLLILVLINFNIILLLLLLLLILRNVVKLIFERRHRPFGTKFRTKLVFVFVGLSLWPTIFLFLVAFNLISESIDNWFNPRVDVFLMNALRVVHDYTDSTRDTALHFGRLMTEEIKRSELLNSKKESDLKNLVEEKQDEYRLGMVQVFDFTGKELIRTANPALPIGKVMKPGSEYFRQALSGKEFFTISQLEEGELLQCGLPIWNKDNPEQVEGILVANYYLPQSLARKINQISNDYERYLQQRQAIFETKGLYITILLMITLTILFAAVWLGFYIARGITIPIERLAEGTRAISTGNMDFQLDVEAGDEIGVLVESFNQMTADLKKNKEVIEKAHEELQQKNLELNRRRMDMEAILENITTGVISIAAGGYIKTMNDSAEKKLGLSRLVSGRAHYREVLNNGFLLPLLMLIENAFRTGTPIVHKQLHMKIGKRPVVFSVSAIPMTDPSTSKSGLLLVIEDLTELLKIQKMAAWQEVARRIAHEIKNPLTPIKLSAERLQKKLSGPAADSNAVFKELTETIIQEVEGLRILVNEFSRFAKMPKAQPQPNDLHKIIDNTIGIYCAVDESVQFARKFDPGVPILQLDAEQIKRALVNLFDNAREAMNGKGTITVSTRYDPVLKIVTLEIGDEGPGVKPDDKDKMFLPYFSTKEKGTGLGLTIVDRIISDHNGFIRLKNRKPTGSLFVIELPALHASIVMGSENKIGNNV